MLINVSGCFTVHANGSFSFNTRWGEPLAVIPVEMPYLLLHEDTAEVTHSGSSSAGMAAPQGSMPRFSPFDVKSWRSLSNEKWNISIIWWRVQWIDSNFASGMLQPEWVNRFISCTWLQCREISFLISRVVNGLLDSTAGAISLCVCVRVWLCLHASPCVWMYVSFSLLSHCE